MSRAAGRFVAATTIGAWLILAGCDPTGTEVSPEDMVVAGVWVVVTIDPADATRTELLATGWLDWSRAVRTTSEVPGASLRIVGESGASVDLAERPSQESCFKLNPLPAHLHAPVFGTCYLATASPSPFAPGEGLSLTIGSPDGGTATGASRLPEPFAPSGGLASEDGRCLTEPDQNHRLSWSVAEGAWAYLGGALIKGLDPALWPADKSRYAGEALHLGGLPVRRDSTKMVFPRDLGLLTGVQPVGEELIRVLQTGLPRGATAQVAVGAIDRNWYNWIRLPTFESVFVNSAFDTGEIRIPSIFGDGLGVFGTSVRWKAEVESRVRTGAGDPPLCGPVEGESSPAGT